LVYRTPLQALPLAGEHISPINVSFGQEGNLPYALDIRYHQKKVMLVEWDEDELRLIEYRPGGWEFLMMGLA
jgi:hypothetical protein